VSAHHVLYIAAIQKPYNLRICIPSCTVSNCFTCEVERPLYRMKHCLGSCCTVVSRQNIALDFALCYICLSSTLFMLYILYNACSSALSTTHTSVLVHCKVLILHVWKETLMPFNLVLT